MPHRDGVVVVHATRQMLLMFQNKVQVVCYEGMEMSYNKYLPFTQAEGLHQVQNPLSHHFSFYHVAEEAKDLEAYKQR